MLNGYKTYLVSIAGLVYAALGYFVFGMDSTAAIQIVQVSLSAMGLRAAL